jgi:hypothetical protein
MGGALGLECGAGWGRCRVGVASWVRWMRGADGVSSLEGRVADGFMNALDAWRNWRGVDWRLIEGVLVVRAKGFLPAFGMRVFRFERWPARWAFGVKNYAKWLASRVNLPTRDIFLRACYGA